MNNMKNKGNIEFTKDYATCCLGNTKLKLGQYDDGDGYNFELNIKLDGLFYNDDNSKYEPKEITLSGNGHQELEVISDMFKDISDIIKENL